MFGIPKRDRVERPKPDDQMNKNHRTKYIDQKKKMQKPDDRIVIFRVFHSK